MGKGNGAAVDGKRQGKQKNQQQPVTTSPVCDSKKRIDAWNKLEELQTHPELAWHPGYSLDILQRDGDPYAWLRLLMTQPQFAPPQEWWNDLWRWSNLPWGQLLAAQPQFTKYCPWEAVSRMELVKLALLAPEIFSRRFPQGRWQDLCPFLTTPEWRHLLIDVPEADKFLDMEEVGKKLSASDWMCILAYRPELEKYFDWTPVEKSPSVYWAYLLRCQPQFADRCDWSCLKGWQIRQILTKQPQLKTPELERLIEEDELWEEYQEEKELGEFQN